MRKIFSYIVYIAILSFSSCCIDDSTSADADGAEVMAVDSISLLVNQIRSCSRLYTAEVKLHKIIVADDPLTIGGEILGQDISVDLPLGDRKIAIPMNGTAKAYIDFSTFSKKNVTIDGDDIIVELPDPKVVLVSTEIDHDEVRKNVSFFRSDFSDKEITVYQKQGREAIIKAVPKSGVLEKAESGAAAVIVPMLMELGYKDKNIQVRFSRNVLSDPATFFKKNLVVK